MIATASEMKKIDRNSGLSSAEIMAIAGKKIAAEITSAAKKNDTIVFLCGPGNNGGDGLCAAAHLTDMHAFIVQPLGKAKTQEASYWEKQLPEKCFVSKRKIPGILKKADLIVDAVFGFSYHGKIESPLAELFDYVNALHKKVISIDLNSGCEADSDKADPHALHSDLTLALQCYKPNHLFRKDHKIFDQIKVLDLGLPLPAGTSYLEMDEKRFLEFYPCRNEDAYKGTFGKTLIIGGSYGMAGALCLNLLGAKTAGAPYIEAALPHEIYAIAAAHFITPVFHPFARNSLAKDVWPLVGTAKAIAFGSGSVNMDGRNDILDYLLQNASAPLVLDAEALRMLHFNTWILRFAKCPVILTPHIGEFAGMLNKPVQYVAEHRIELAQQFAKKNKVTLVLKDPHTIAAFADGTMYVNQSGCAALAQAGSGDLLTGIMAGILTRVPDIKKAVPMAIWLHGYLSEQSHSREVFPLEDYPHLMDIFLQKHNM